jgi:hypothetical protein
LAAKAFRAFEARTPPPSKLAVMSDVRLARPTASPTPTGPQRTASGVVREVIPDGAADVVQVVDLQTSTDTPIIGIIQTSS